MIDTPFQLYKIQRPLGGHMGQALTYNEDRSLTTFLPMNRQLRRLFREHGNPPKLYVQARHHGDTFEIDEVALDQEAPW